MVYYLDFLLYTPTLRCRVFNFEKVISLGSKRVKPTDTEILQKDNYYCARMICKHSDPL